MVFQRSNEAGSVWAKQCSTTNCPIQPEQLNFDYVCVCFRLKRITSLKIDSHHLHPRLIYNSLIRSTFCRMVDKCGWFGRYERALCWVCPTAETILLLCKQFCQCSCLWWVASLNLKQFQDGGKKSPWVTATSSTVP